MAMSTLFSIAVLVAASFLLSIFKAQISSGSSFYDDFTLSGAVEQVSTSSDGAIWSLALTNATGTCTCSSVCPMYNIAFNGIDVCL